MATVITNRVKEIIGYGDRLFGKRTTLLNRWQEIALNFHPTRADFTATPDIGTDWMAHLMTGRPVLAHRDLSNSLSSMLRPRGKVWFHPRTSDEDVNSDASARAYLDWIGNNMRRAMYEPRAQFINATKTGDYDFIAFGNAVIRVEVRKDRTGFIYRPKHLRDTAWRENAELMVDEVHCKWKPTVKELCDLFGDKCADEVKAAHGKGDLYSEINCRHVLMPAGDYDLNYNKIGTRKLPFVSIYIDCDNGAILEEVPWHENDYVIPRWLRPQGSPYGHSMATIVALPDARMLQAMNLTLLEAGEKLVDPPLKATRQAIQGGVNWFGGGITWVDADYDERMGPALEPLLDAPKGLDWVTMREEKIEQLIAEAFFLNKITLPQPQDGEKMTAEEVRHRFEEYVRGAVPLFEPMETEYNGALCEITYNKMLRMGRFGSYRDVPQILRKPDTDLRWEFDSPLQAAQERAKATSFVEMCGLLKTAAEFDPNVVADVEFDDAFRDALTGNGTPAKWIKPKPQADKDKAEMREQQAAEDAAKMAGQAGAIAEQIGLGAEAIKRGNAPVEMAA
jgi:hypothetical protein